MAGSVAAPRGASPLLADKIGVRGVATLSRCELALLPGGTAADALRAFAETESKLEAEERMSARSLLWRATGDRAHLAEAKRLLDESLAKVPAEHHATTLANVRVNREITAAVEAAGL